MALLIGITLGLIALVGAALIVKGLRGRRIDDHPLCRACRFDLSGLPDTSDCCPECGQNVHVGDVIIVGRRELRAGLVGLGLVMVLGAMSPLGGMLWLGARSADWRISMPTWYLLREADGILPTSREAAIAELLRRDQLASLNVNDKVSAARAMIALERDPAAKWDRAMANFVKARIADDSLPADLRDAFLRRALAGFELRTRTSFRQGSGLPLRLYFRLDRFGDNEPSANKPVIRVRIGARTLDLDGQSFSRQLDSMAEHRFYLTNNSGYSGYQERAELFASITPGRHRLTWRVPVSVEMENKPQAPRVLFTDVLTLDTTVDVLPPDAVDIEVVSDPAMKSQIENALKIDEFELGPGGQSVTVSYRMNSTLPVELAGHLFLRRNGEEVRLGSFVLANNNGSGRQSSVHATTRPFKVGAVEVLFRSDADVARQTLETNRIWGGELHFRDVQIVDKERY